MIEESSVTVSTGGTVESVLFKNVKSGYAVVDLATETQELVTVVGQLGNVETGEHLNVTGKFTTHPRFGRQLQAETFERELPNSSENIEKYLSSGIIKGVSKGLAKKIVAAFGKETFNIIENEPEKLMQIKGVTKKKCKDISENLQKIFCLRSITAFLTEFNIPPQFAVRAFMKWGTGAFDRIKDNPYALCSEGVELQFSEVNLLAERLEMPINSQKRIRAGIIYVLNWNTVNGNTCVPSSALCTASCRFLEIGESDYYEAYNKEIEAGNIIEYIIGDKGFIYLADYYEAEDYIASRLNALEDYANDQMTPEQLDAVIEIQENESGIKYAEKQRDAIIAALHKGVTILTGGPGTGKTTTLNAIISLLQKSGNRVMITAPTGRAAKRVSELTGFEAKTVHRLLEVIESQRPGETGGIGFGFSFKHDEDNLLECDALIIDEMSMVDVPLFQSLLRALPLHCKIIMVGDCDQLPPVGAGNLLEDIIGSKRIHVTVLDKIFRQSQASYIVLNAHKITNGEYPDLARRDSDFFFFSQDDPVKVVPMITDLVNRRLPNAYGYSPLTDIQVITPSRKGPTGVIELNKSLQAAVNPSHIEKNEVKTMLYTFRSGDKVMQMKNNYTIVWKKSEDSQISEGTGVFNGDIGRIISISRGSSQITVDFDGRIVTYGFDMLDQLELAYAITVHKSQGSEFEAVIVPISSGFEKLSYRSLLYTAVTRAKKLLIVIGTETKIQKMVDNNKKTLRCSCLKYILANGNNSG
ncbi:MAG: ATP-dependent RecD-like DNA helicase [Oscillospiraceae bacterium]|jgi:exodeoxyribonuclease V alpha subunit|nr:ATP-dependent RecD-like DNA helicase [Oscillospiraceae bacterium]